MSSACFLLREFNLLTDLRQNSVYLLQQVDFAMEVSSCVDPLDHVKLRGDLLCIQDLLEQLMRVDCSRVSLVSVEYQKVKVLVSVRERKDLENLPQVLIADETRLFPVNSKDVLNRQVIPLDKGRNPAQQVLVVIQRIRGLLQSFVLLLELRTIFLTISEEDVHELTVVSLAIV